MPRRSGEPRDADSSWQETVASVSGVDRGFARRHRLRLSRFFDEAFQRGPIGVGRYMVVWERTSEGACLRMGVVASRRTFPRAVERSRAKRLLREAYRLNRFRFEAGRDFVIVAKRAILGAGLQQVEKDLGVLARKARVLRERCDGIG